MALSLSRGPSVDTEKCVTQIGGRFELVLAATVRAREIRRQHRESDKFEHVHSTVTALLEIQEGKIGREYLKRVK